ncbi:hypothetical protein BP6252_14168 [Coleophoma cylindrospora]|uniref:Uncharacterized protein n=1 Tax=Coleophoma cylindrospora TaxID=1849047 RepID=A0A3D8Q3W7_9HELO|nr:hypothetical protein BP6252_14168 [Coleophoma cylindrospora]
MRLLDTQSLDVVDVPDDAIPEYAILSHTWGPDEVGFHELGVLAREWQSSYKDTQSTQSNQRLAKVIGAAVLAAKNGYKYIWMDTCCIDKSSSAELSEAINSMYRWYEQAAVCYVYLSDVTLGSADEARIMEEIELEQSSFRKSRWFTRGWTLQELIAPSDVRFYAQDWSFIGSHKENVKLRHLLSRITGVDDRVLAGSLSPQDLSVSTRMKWAALRRTTRAEDIAYCLMGIFGVNMPLLYGEGKRAFIRLQDEILKETDDQSLFAWTSPEVDRRNSDEICGLLATSPLSFRDAGNVRPLPPVLTRDSAPSSVTNQGLRIQLYLAPVGGADNEYHAILDCSLRHEDHEYCPSIYLRRLWGDQFARVRPDRCVLLPPPTNDLPNNDGGYQTVFVKQRPVYIMPEFTLPTGDVRLPLIFSDGESYLLQAVYPPDRWDSGSMALKSVYAQINSVMGIFRFSHPQNPDVQVDIAVGLRRKKQNRWESWCTQQRCQGNPLDVVFQTFDRRLRATNQQLDINGSFVYQKSHGSGQQIASSAEVIDTQMHGRSYIALHVFEKPEIDTARELASRPFPETEIPLTYAPEIISDFESEIHELIMACSVQDALDLSVFPTTELTTRVRMLPNANKHANTLMDELRASLSYIHPTQLRVRDADVKMPQFEKTLSAELLYACKEGNALQVQRLIRASKTKACIEAESENFHSFRPIHWAAIGGHLEVIQILLSVGALELSLTSQNMTVIHLAVMMGHIEVLNYFFERAANAGLRVTDLLDAKIKGTLETAYHLATAYGPKEDIADFLATVYTIDKEMNPAMDPANYLDETPLHRASAVNNLEAVEWLLKWNANIDGVDQFLRTPIWHAASTGASDTLRVLGESGALLHLADHSGRTPLDAACRGGRVEAVKVLLELGANPNCVSEPLCMTSAHYAALFGHHECLELLIEHDADIDFYTAHRTYFKAVHLAAANGWYDCVQQLCAAGSDPDSPSSHYILIGSGGGGANIIARNTGSAEEIAFLQGHQEVVKFLQQWRAEKKRQMQELAATVPNRDPRLDQNLIDLGSLRGDPILHTSN